MNAVMETAKEVNSPVIIQFSNGGAVFVAGKALNNDNQSAAVLGAVSGAKHVHMLAEKYGVSVILHTDHCAKKLLPWMDGMVEANEKHFEETGAPLFSSHMLDLSEEPLEENIEISSKYFERMSKMGITLEIELGVTGGEEDGVDNTDIDNSRLYTQPEEVAYSYENLKKISSNFTIAAAFGNVHGVYKPGNVKLTPTILKNSQDYIQEKFGTGPNPVNFVFHGGSGSTVEEIREAIDYGAIKMNIDTDMQWATWEGVMNYYKANEGYLQAQIGNPDGDDASGNDVFSAEPSINDWFETVKLNYGIDYQSGGAKHFDPIPDTWKKMLDILLFWAEKKVDALRCDMAEMVPLEFWTWVTHEVKKKYPNILFIAEAYQHDLYRPYLHKGGFDYLYDKVDLYDTLKDIIRGHQNADAITSVWQRMEGIEDQMLRFLENHDEQRIASPEFAGDPKKGIPMMASSAFMHKGPVMMYMGQELGEPAKGASGFSGDDGRTTIFDYWSVTPI
ncbi:fba [Symbiodinium microadriaticum]|nr:fba [Symbiodinium microadriaticum]